MTKKSLTFCWSYGRGFGAAYVVVSIDHKKWGWILNSKFGKQDTFAWLEAARLGDITTLKKYLELGMPVDQILPLYSFVNDGEGILYRKYTEDTALILAARRGHFDAVDLLLKAGVSVNQKQYLGHTALSLAEREGHTEIIKRLLEAKASPDLGSSLGSFPLTDAVAHNDVIAVDLLLKAGSQKADEGLKIAVYGRTNLAIYDLLLKAGASANQVIRDAGVTILMVAAALTSIDVVKRLVAYGAKINAKDIVGKTAVDYAKNDEIRLFLESVSGGKATKVAKSED